VADLKREIAAGFGKLAIMADKQPVPIPDHLHIKPEEVRIGIKGLRQAEARSPVADHRQHLRLRIHVRPRTITRTELVVLTIHRDQSGSLNEASTARASQNGACKSDIKTKQRRQAVRCIQAGPCSPIPVPSAIWLTMPCSMSPT